MNKKMILSILTVVMLIAMSFTFVVGAQTDESTDKYESSPLYRIRTEKAIGEKLQEIKLNYVGERIFFLPLLYLYRQDLNENNNNQDYSFGCKAFATVLGQCFTLSRRC